MPAAASRIHLLVVPALLLTVLATAGTAALLPTSSAWLAALLLSLLAVSYVRMTLTALGPLLGLLPQRPAAAAAPARRGRHRTAILLPIYNEAPEPIAAAVRVMAEALRPDDDAAIFVLSDTQDPALAARERRLFDAHMTSRSGIEIRYRRRPRNTGRKAGNIGEFCRGAGRDYAFAIVLDADSLMTGQAIRGLIAALAEDAGAGLIQSVSYLVGGHTLFARMQQFAARLNTPLAVAGQHLWQGRLGTYWGHNAILRLAPFTRHAELPVLPGRPPMGGQILCHDTIEAALLLRAGWAVRLAPEIVGSYETTPSNLVDHLARERRWCQGNLQHLRLIGAARLRPESRLHIGIGILYYLSSPVSLLLSLGLLLGASGHARPHAASPALLVQLLVWLTLLLLFGPRLASLARALLRPRAARGFGGRARLIASALLEQLAATLLSPIIMLSVTGFVLSTFAGRVVAWDAPSRGDRPVPWREAWRRMRWHTVLGIGAALALWLGRPAALPWASPLLLGPVLSMPLTMLSGSVRLGALTRRLGLFLTEDELTPTAELAALQGAPPRRPPPVRYPVHDPAAAE